MSKQQSAMSTSLIEARKEFREFETTTIPYSSLLIDHAVSKIRKYLAEARFDASALDPTGMSTVKDMEGRIEKAVVRAHLISARSNLEEFETTTIPYSSRSIDHAVSKIRGHFMAAGMDASALDPSGKATSAQMEARIERAALRARSLSGGPA